MNQYSDSDIKRLLSEVKTMMKCSLELQKDHISEEDKYKLEEDFQKAYKPNQINKNEIIETNDIKSLNNFHLYLTELKDLISKGSEFKEESSLSHYSLSFKVNEININFNYYLGIFQFEHLSQLKSEFVISDHLSYLSSIKKCVKNKIGF